jgi:hypothetical protein
MGGDLTETGGYERTQERNAYVVFLWSWPRPWAAGEADLKQNVVFLWSWLRPWAAGEADLKQTCVFVLISRQYVMFMDGDLTEPGGCDITQAVC